MIISRRGFSLALFAVALMTAAGCSTTINVNSTPPGAEVYARGKGRAAYKWEYKGTTPVSYDSYYNKEQVRVRWDDKIFSDTQDVGLIGTDDAAVTFTR